MASRRLGGVLFVAYPQDHTPRHVHGFHGETEVIIELAEDGTVTIASRRDAVRPADAKRSDIRRILIAAAEHFDSLAELWERMHG